MKKYEEIRDKLYTQCTKKTWKTTFPDKRNMKIGKFLGVKYHHICQIFPNTFFFFFLHSAQLCEYFGTTKICLYCGIKVEP
jgi:hypothetical protein